MIENSDKITELENKILNLEETINDTKTNKTLSQSSTKYIDDITNDFEIIEDDRISLSSVKTTVHKKPLIQYETLSQINRKTGKSRGKNQSYKGLQ